MYFHDVTLQVLAYVERLCSGAGGPSHAAMFVAKPDFFSVLGAVIKNSKNVALRVQALHVGGLLLRHAPVISIAISESVFVMQAVDDLKLQQVRIPSNISSRTLAQLPPSSPPACSHALYSFCIMLFVRLLLPVLPPFKSRCE
jgi:hypothetical protein